MALNQETIDAWLRETDSEWGAEETYKQLATGVDAKIRNNVGAALVASVGEEKITYYDSIVESGTIQVLLVGTSCSYLLRSIDTDLPTVQVFPNTSVTGLKVISWPPLGTKHFEPEQLEFFAAFGELTIRFPLREANDALAEDRAALFGRFKKLLV